MCTGQANVVATYWEVYLFSSTIDYPTSRSVVNCTVHTNGKVGHIYCYVPLLPWSVMANLVIKDTVT